MTRLRVKSSWMFLLLIFFVFGLIFCLKSINASTDALAIRVFENKEHYSALTWYKKRYFTGAPQSIVVDGYEAVRDGRTVYVNAANVINAAIPPTPGGMATNIYLISYNQDAQQSTKDVFGRVLDVWKFNTNINGYGQCVRSDNSKGNNCNLDNDCLIDEYCDSEKAKLVRDVKRWSDLADIRIKLEEYKNSNLQRVYPQLSAGTYIPGISLSVWPSWKNALSKELGISLPIDPINRLRGCSAPYNEKTCWDEHALKFVSPASILISRFNADSRLIAYREYDVAGSSKYQLCSMMESGYISDVVGTIVDGIDVSGSCGINL